MTDVEAPKILILSGSIRTPSYTRTLSTCVGDELTRLGAAVTHWDALEPPLPLADPTFHKSAFEYPDPGVIALDTLATATDAFVFATPVYHNSYSGVLKNILDLLNIRPHFQMKPVGLISHGGDRSSQAVDHLRIVARGLNAVASPTQVCTQRTDFEEEGSSHRVANEQILDRIHRLSTELIALAMLLRPLQHPNAMQHLVDSLSTDTVD